MTNKPELLLPAGDMESVKAAVLNGADAVYLGAKLFSARQNAANFDKTHLAEAVRYAKVRGVKVYQTLNTLLFDRELSIAARVIADGCEAGIDAFIVQDWGVVSLIRSISSDVRIHGSTQMSVHTKKGAEALLSMGHSRVVLSRELSLAEISQIAKSVPIETEVFVHGALCMSMSGQCYISGMIGGRSGNRGSCAGTCRLPFSHRRNKEDYDLSLKDLCALSHLEELSAAGVTSFKIEGRMKRPEYVAACAQVYRAKLDGGTADETLLRDVFARSGFTDGYLTGKRGAAMFGVRSRDDVVRATPKLLRSLEHSYQSEKGRIPLSFSLSVQKDMPVSLSGTDVDGNTAVRQSDPPEIAREKAFSVEAGERILKKLGGTIFVPDQIHVSCDDGLMVPVSKLNELRRSVCEAIEEQRGVIPPVKIHRPEPVEENKKPVKRTSGKEPFLFARFESISQVPFSQMEHIGLFSLPFLEVAAHIDVLKPYGNRLLIELPRMMASREDEVEQTLKMLHEQGLSRVVCENIAHVRMANDLGMEPAGGVFLNVTNSESARMLCEMGVSHVTLSFEIAAQDAVRINVPVPCGAVVYGYLPLMLVRNCPVQAKTGCASCDGRPTLTDRRNTPFYVMCRRPYGAEILNGTPLWMADRMQELSSLSYGLLYFTREDMQTCASVIRAYCQKTSSEQPYTRGLYYRSV